MTDKVAVINSTKHWLNEIIVGLNFCPFAKKEVVNNTIRYQVINSDNVEHIAEQLLTEFHLLVEDTSIETTLIIFPVGYSSFYHFIDLISLTEGIVIDNKYEGQFQVASFHPLYCFDGCAVNDVTNFTNRSPWPMLHIIREGSIEKALQTFAEPELIPERNMALARKKGTKYFEDFLHVCHNKSISNINN